jgi:hypothetical protein
MFRAIVPALLLALIVAFPAAGLAQEGAPDDPKPPAGLKPAGETPKLTPAEEEEALRQRKKKFFKMYKSQLEEMEQTQDDPEKEEIARLTELKGDYRTKLGQAEKDFKRAKEIVKRSFVGLMKSDQPKETIEGRCENIWLDYMATSRKSKMQMHEYERAITGVQKRIKYIRHRLATRDYPTAEKGQMYYSSDPIEVYTDESMMETGEMASAKSQVSYYAMLKDFVLEISGVGRADMKVIARKIAKPPILEMYEAWQRNAKLRSASTPKEK